MKAFPLSALSLWRLFVTARPVMLNHPSTTVGSPVRQHPSGPCDRVQRYAQRPCGLALPL